LKEQKIISDSDNKYFALIENSLQGIIILQDNKIAYANPAFAKISGYTVAELLKMNTENVLSLIHPDDRKMIFENVQMRLAGKNIPPHNKFNLIDKDGEIKLLDIFASRIEFEGKPAVQGLILDITAQAIAKKYLELRTKIIETVLNNLPLGIAVNEISSGETTFMNTEFCDISGLTTDNKPNLNKFINKAFSDPERRKIISNKFKTDIKEKKPEDLFWNTVEIEQKGGEKKYIIAKTIPLYSQDLMIFTVQDVTERVKTELELQSSLVEKETLFREIHHRVKNNLQTISSLLDLQAETITDKRSLEAFKSSQSRIRSMALIHERLYKSENLSRIKAREYINSLVDYLGATYQLDGGIVTLKSKVKNIFLNLDVAIPCGLIINELVSNSMKYAFPGSSEGEVIVSLLPKDKNLLELKVKDNGIGIPENIIFEDSPSLGLQLVDLLVKQINGKFEITRSNGTEISIIFSRSSSDEIIETESDMIREKEKSK